MLKENISHPESRAVLEPVKMSELTKSSEINPAFTDLSDSTIYPFVENKGDKRRFTFIIDYPLNTGKLLEFINQASKKRFPKDFVALDMDGDDSKITKEEYNNLFEAHSKMFAYATGNPGAFKRLLQICSAIDFAVTRESQLRRRPLTELYGARESVSDFVIALANGQDISRIKKEIRKKTGVIISEVPWDLMYLVKEDLEAQKEGKRSFVEIEPLLAASSDGSVEMAIFVAYTQYKNHYGYVNQNGKTHVLLDDEYKNSLYPTIILDTGNSGPELVFEQPPDFITRSFHEIKTNHYRHRNAVRHLLPAAGTGWPDRYNSTLGGILPHLVDLNFFDNHIHDTYEMVIAEQQTKSVQATSAVQVRGLPMLLNKHYLRRSHFLQKLIDHVNYVA